MTHPTIIQNNLAIAHLRANNIKPARLLLTSALQHQHILGGASGSEPGHQSPRSGSADEAESRIDQCMLLLNPTDQVTCTEEVNTFIYRDGIEIPSAEANQDTIAAVVIFNTALAHHLLAQEESDNAALYLEKAKTLYELAYRTQVEGTKNLLLEFATLNNIATVYRELGVEPTAKKLLDSLLSIWMVFVDRGCDLQMHQVRGFLVNLATADENIAGAAAA